MKRVVAQGDRWYVAEAPEPSARPGEAVVRITRAPIETLDLARAMVSGRCVTPGRELVGLVKAASGVDSAWEGKRVVVRAAIICGICDLCRSGLSAHCREKSEIGVHRDGTLAERVCIPTANLFEIPKILDDDRAAFALPLGRALHAAQFVRLEGMPYVTIIGDGVTGLLAAQLMTQRNASVRVLGREPARFGLCERWGVKHRHVNDVGRRADQDVVFLCSEHAGDLEIALRLARPRGKVLLMGDAAGEPEARCALSLVRDNEIALIGSRGERIAEAVRVLAEDGVDVRSLITARYRLQQAPDAIERAARPESVRILLDMA